MAAACRRELPWHLSHRKKTSVFVQNAKNQKSKKKELQLKKKYVNIYMNIYVQDMYVVLA